MTHGQVTITDLRESLSCFSFFGSSLHVGTLRKREKEMDIGARIGARIYVPIWWDSESQAGNPCRAGGREPLQRDPRGM